MNLCLSERPPAAEEEAFVRSAPKPSPQGRLGIGILMLVGDVAALMAGFTFVADSRLKAACLVLILMVLAARGYHRVGLALSIGNDAAGIVAAVAVPVVLLSMLQADPQVCRELVRGGALATGAVLAARAGLYAVVRSERARGVLLEATVVVGAGKLGVEVARVLRDHPEYGLTPVGFVDDVASDEALPLPLLGPVSSLESVIRQHGARRVVVAFGPAADAKVVEVVRACDRAAVQLHVLPRFFELASMTAITEEVWGLPLVRLGRSLVHPVAARAKRVFDVVVAAIALVVAAPVMIVVAALVRRSSPGPVLFRQKRVGQDGEIVEVLKFRSMRVNDDCDTQWSVAADDRVTPVGNFLRRTSMDELPQLLNVLRGEMSLVGPRPERPFYVERFNQEVDGYRHRHRAPVGMTGWAQVHGLRGDTSIKERARFDNSYIENWSPWRDVVTLGRTLRQLRGRGPTNAVGVEATPAPTAPSGLPATTPAAESAF